MLGTYYRPTFLCARCGSRSARCSRPALWSDYCNITTRPVLLELCSDNLSSVRMLCECHPPPPPPAPKAITPFMWTGKDIHGWLVPSKGTVPLTKRFVLKVLRENIAVKITVKVMSLVLKCHLRVEKLVVHSWFYAGYRKSHPAFFESHSRMVFPKVLAHVGKQAVMSP